MSDFSFTATAECDYCGNLLGSSDGNCDECSEEGRYQQFFRAIGDREPHVICVEATHDYKWYKLASEVGEDWIAYEWLGPRESVQSMVGLSSWETIDDVPGRAISADAPNDVADEA